MGDNAINNIIMQETRALKILLAFLEEQHDILIKNDILEIEEIVEKIQVSNKLIAEAEVERRKIVNGNSMKDVLDKLNDEETDINYRNIKKLINEVKVQKDTNEMLIKMNLSFSIKMLNILQPDIKLKTYNANGKLKR